MATTEIKNRIAELKALDKLNNKQKLELMQLEVELEELEKPAETGAEYCIRTSGKDKYEASRKYRTQGFRSKLQLDGPVNGKFVGLEAFDTKAKKDQPSRTLNRIMFETKDGPVTTPHSTVSTSTSILTFLDTAIIGETYVWTVEDGYLVDVAVPAIESELIEDAIVIEETK